MLRWGVQRGRLSHWRDRPGAGCAARLFSILAQRLGAAAPEEQARIIEALGSFRTREAVRLLGRYLGDAKPAVSAAAVSALSRLSARDDLGNDRGVWAAWVHEVDGISDSLWRLRLIGALAAKNDHLLAERHDAVSQLTDALRKLHLATKAEERPALLASLLDNEIPAVRNLGFELVARELSATGHLDGPVGVAALKLLQNPEAAVRGSAAVLVRQLAPPGAETAIADALVTENDPAAASDLLLAAARWPSPAVVAPVLRWIDAGPPAADSATEAAWWLLRAGELGPGDEERVLGAVRHTAVEGLSPAGVSLLASLGDDEDRERLAPLLTASSAALRQVTGESLVWYPRYRKAILDAAAKDPDLFDVACRAVVVDEPTADGLRSLLALPKPSAEVAQAAILRVARRMPADDLRAVSLEVTDPVLKRALLADLTSPERVMSQKSDPKMMGAIADGAADLADMDLNQGQADAALATLDAVGLPEGVGDAARLACLRCTAQLALGRLEDAQHVEGTCESWIRGLEMAKATPGAGKILAALDARFPELTPEQRVRVDAVREQVKRACRVITEVGPPRPVSPVATAGAGHF